MAPNDHGVGMEIDAIDPTFDNEHNKLLRKMEILEQKIKAGMDPERYQGWRVRSRLKPGKNLIKITLIAPDKTKIQTRRALKDFLLDTHGNLNDFKHMLFVYQAKWSKPWKHVSSYWNPKPIEIPRSFNGIPIKDIPHKSYFSGIPLLDSNGDMFWPADKIKADNSLDKLPKDTFEVHQIPNGEKIVISKEEEARNFKIAAQRSWLLIDRKERRNRLIQDGSKDIEEDCHYATLMPEEEVYMSAKISQAPLIIANFHPLGLSCQENRQWLTERSPGPAETNVTQSFSKPVMSSEPFCKGKYDTAEWPDEKWARRLKNFNTREEFDKFVDLKKLDSIYGDFEARLTGKTFSLPHVSLHPHYKNPDYAMRNIYINDPFHAYRNVV